MFYVKFVQLVNLTWYLNYMLLKYIFFTPARQHSFEESKTLEHAGHPNLFPWGWCPNHWSGQDMGEVSKCV